MSRAGRLFQLLQALRSHRHPVTAGRLATQLAVSDRTVYRDIATLREQGARIDGEAGLGYQLRAGFLLPALVFSEEEIEALVLGARWVAWQADPELAQAARQALERISACLPAHLRVVVDTSGLFAPSLEPTATPEPWLPALRRAIRLEQKIMLGYRDANGVITQRTVWPFAMAFFQQSRMMAAWCELRQSFRHFRADRVASLEDTGERYPTRRHTLMKHWRAQTGHNAEPD